MMPSSLLAQSALQRLSFREIANSKVGQETDQLYIFIVWVCIISFVILMGMMMYFVVKYRRAAGGGARYQKSPGHNTTLELAWSIGPLIVMVFIFFWGFWGYMDKLAAPGGAEDIRIKGQQWNWSAMYSNGREPGPEALRMLGTKNSPVIYVPAGRPVRLLMTSSDVIHAFYIPAFRTKMDVFPNRYTSITFTPERAGEEHEVFCAEYCGQDHSEMAAWIKVVEPAEFEAYKASDPVFESIVEKGKFLWRSKGCSACHSIDGTAGTGPTWKNMWGHAVELTDGTTAMVDENYVRSSVYDPALQLVKGYGPQMNSYRGLVNEDQLFALMAFMKSISDKGGSVEGSPAGEAPSKEPGAAAPATPPQPAPH
jgi:cytochrome c oxidase subunit 2